MSMKKTSLRLAVTFSTLLLAPQPVPAATCGAQPDCIEVEIPEGSDELDIVEAVETGWNQGDFSCSAFVDGDELEITYTPAGGGKKRTVTYDLPFDADTGEVIGHTIRLVAPAGRFTGTYATCSEVMPFQIFASFGADPEQELLDNSPVIFPTPAAEIEITATTVVTCQPANAGAVPALGTRTVFIAGLVLLVGGAVLVMLRS